MFGLNDAESTNALDLLKRDHKEVDDLFQQFEDAKEDGNRKLRGEIAAQICAALTVHATIEENRIDEHQAAKSHRVTCGHAGECGRTRGMSNADDALEGELAGQLGNVVDEP